FAVVGEETPLVSETALMDECPEPLEGSFALDGGPAAFAQFGLVQSGDEDAHVRPRLAGLDAVEPQPPIALCLDVDLLVAEVDHRGVEDVSGDEVDVPSCRVLTGAFEAGRKQLEVYGDVEARARLSAHDGEQTFGELAVTGDGAERAAMKLGLCRVLRDGTEPVGR